MVLFGQRQIASKLEISQRPTHLSSASAVNFRPCSVVCPPASHPDPFFYVLVVRMHLRKSRLVQVRFRWGPKPIAAGVFASPFEFHVPPATHETPLRHFGLLSLRVRGGSLS
jgi:hypothetical protein